MARKPRPGAYDPAKGRRDYEALGPLTPADLAYLAVQPTDRARRATFTAWYGRHGGVYAWRLHRGLDAATYHRPVPV